MYAVYQSIFSSGAAMVLNKSNSSNKRTAAHRKTCGTLWASGDAQTPAELPSPADISTGAAMVFKITNSNKGTAAYRDKCHTAVWASRDAQTHNLLPAELQLVKVFVAGETHVRGFLFVSNTNNLSIQ